MRVVNMRNSSDNTTRLPTPRKERNHLLMKTSSYIPALRFDTLTRFYDPLMALGLRENTFKNRLIERTNIQSDSSVLDLGCGTATLTLLIKQRYPGANVSGVDGDPTILAIAEKKNRETNMSVNLKEAMAYDLPFPDASIDRIVSSLVFHHLTREQKRRALAEAFRVLRPGGEIHIADWGKPRSWPMRLAFYQVQFLDGFDITQDSVDGRLQEFIGDAGFQRVEETDVFATVLGSISIYQGTKPT